jgi:hypothetical protein
MNTDSLSALYDQLNPPERVPLVIAAWSRGDTTELTRLHESAPTALFEVSDHRALTKALQEVVFYHLLTLLDLAAHFWQWWGLMLSNGLRDQAAAAAAKGRRGKPAPKRAETLRDAGLARYFASRFVAHVEGWKQFCAAQHLDPEAQLTFMIGWDNIKRTESQARELAFSAEEAAWFVRLETVRVDGDESQQRGPDPVETPEEVARGWHGALAMLVSQEKGA